MAIPTAAQLYPTERRPRMANEDDVKKILEEFGEEIRQAGLEHKKRYI